MRIQFRDRFHSIPPPLPGPGEKVIEVEKIAVFPVPLNAGDHRFRFANAFSKLMFFTFREGLRLTYHKVKASLLQRQVIAEKAVVLAFGKYPEDSKYAIGVAPQYCPKAESLAFPAGCCLEVPRDHDLRISYDILSEYFRVHPDQLEVLYYYSPYSEKSLPFDLPQIFSGKNLSVSQARSGEQTKIQPLRFSDTAGYSKKGSPGGKEETGRFSLFLAGAGSYASAYILPTLRGLHRHTVIDHNPALAAVIGQQYGFDHRETFCDKALSRLTECETPVLVVATYHSTHLTVVRQALGINPNTKVFLEKPPVTSREELAELLQMRRSGAFIEIGYNRRYSPFVRRAAQLLAAKRGPIVMSCIVKELKLPETHWYYWPGQGTRITGNLCHWLDLGVCLIGQPPVAATLNAPPGLPAGDEVSATVLFADGSRLTVMATDRGNPLRGVQEYIDIRREDLTVTIDDFTCMTALDGGRRRTARRIIRDKGHRTMYREFGDNLVKGRPPQYPDGDLISSTLLYLSLTDAALRGEPAIDASKLTADRTFK